MRLLVTGATGCVGRAVVAAALRDGHEVRSLARRGPFPGGTEPVAASVEDAASVARAAAGCDGIIHLASWVHRVARTADEKAELHRTIVDGSANVARAARATGARLVFASTVAVFGQTGPDTPYGAAKQAAEDEVRGLVPHASILRLALVYGPHDRGNVATLMRAIERRVAFVVGDGENRKSIVYAGNLADRILLCVARGLEGTYIVADEAPTQRELVSALARAPGRRPPPRLPRAPLVLAGRLVDAVMRGLGRPPRWADRVDKLARSTFFDGAELDRRLGYRPRVALGAALAETVASRG